MGEVEFKNDVVGIYAIVDALGSLKLPYQLSISFFEGKWPDFCITAVASHWIWVAAAATLRNPIDGSPPGSTVPGILQGRTLEWVAISFSYSLDKRMQVRRDAPTVEDSS